MNEQEEKAYRPKYDYSNLPKWIEDAYVVAVEAAQQKIQFDCARCRESWSCPTLTIERRREVADLVRRRLINEALEFFRLAGFTFVAAKRTYEHITIVSGQCHKCKRILSGDFERVVCRCRSMNLKW